jgi:hypothetical protein
MAPMWSSSITLETVQLIFREPGAKWSSEMTICSSCGDGK